MLTELDTKMLTKKLDLGTLQNIVTREISNEEEYDRKILKNKSLMGF